jgi:hypothetical protein
MTYILGLLLFIVIIWGFGIYVEKKRTKRVRKQLVNGSRKYIVHWNYEEDLDFAEVQTRDNGLRLSKKKLSNVKDVYICQEGILLGEEVYLSWEKYAKFKELKITNEEPSCIAFLIEYQTEKSSNEVKIFIPIPKEKELEAVLVLDRLIGTVHYEY